jgi:hypothetical protein
MVVTDGLMVVDRGRMPTEPHEVTIVNFRASAIRRTADSEVITYRFIRIRSEAINNVGAGDASIIAESTRFPPNERHHFCLRGHRPFAGAYGSVMPVPLAQSLSLGEAAVYVAERCHISIEDAQSALDRAFREYSLSMFDCKTQKSIQGLRASKIDWKTSTVIGGEYLTINGIQYTARVHVYRRHLDLWIGRPASAAPSPSSTSPDPIYRTGLPGKPTSWHLLEFECRDRYGDGERHPHVSTGRESPSEWAAVLTTWLQSAYPTVACPTRKTLTNRLSALLRELGAIRA